ncbi:nuclear transport factor 2 family protein [Streptomyces sp. NPDC004539]|uniref:nuclear transport factor 2 family protein n=1 Tax=Streptomyces sp. NPDC004539 TaxID=3154280 RepID=UPI0033BBC7DF
MTHVQPHDPVVRAFVDAVNANDRARFLTLLTPDATMSDDHRERELLDWIDREIFSVHGHFEILSQSDDGLSLVARFRNDTWGEMRTGWRFVVNNGLISRFETGQA